MRRQQIKSEKVAAFIRSGPIFAIILGLVCVPARSMTDHLFTVQDSIEISYIIDASQTSSIELRDQQPTGSPIISPNGQFVLLVTQKGVLQTNQLEATLWVFDYGSIRNFVLGRSQARPVPTPIAKCEASSNTSVIADVRWLSDSRRISFLGKNKTAFQQLFIAEIGQSEAKPVTPNGSYVSEYAIDGETIVYTSLMVGANDLKPNSEVVNVGQADILSLLYPRPLSLEDLDEGALQSYPAKLHIQRNGHEIPFDFRLGQNPLRLFSAPLSLSPDAKFLITIAPVAQISESWRNYRPADDLDFLRLTPENTYALAEDNPWKASQYVLIDLRDGTVSTLVEAPAGRGLAYQVSSNAVWSADSRSAIILNTFLPIEQQSGLSAEEITLREQAPAVATIDIFSRHIQPVFYIGQRPITEKSPRQVTGAAWKNSDQQIRLSFSDVRDDTALKISESFTLREGKWTSVGESSESTSQPGCSICLSVIENLNESPTLVGAVGASGPNIRIWDPNPQLHSSPLGLASIYHWKDHEGRAREGVLVLPANYDAKTKYPLVIQTHGFNPDRFLADGTFTTGSGGRALAAKGVVIFQMDLPLQYYADSRDGDFELDGLESLVDGLSSAGIVDRQRVGIIGFSYTCYHVLYAITHRPDLFAAAAITDGNNMSYVQYVMTLNPRKTVFQDDLEKTNGGIPFADGLKPWSQNAPGFNLSKVKTPLLISALERGELISQWEIFSGLRRLNKPVHMIWLRSETAPHILVKPRERFISQQSAVAWFDFWLNGREEDHVSEVLDYPSWRKLRVMEAKKPQ